MKKKTLCIGINCQDIIAALMNKIGWKEVDRVASGGMMSSEFLMITYEGEESDYSEDYYVKVGEKPNGQAYYYSLRCVNGYHTDNFNLFKKEHDRVGENKIIVHQFDKTLTTQTL